MANTGHKLAALRALSVQLHESLPALGSYNPRFESADRAANSYYGLKSNKVTSQPEEKPYYRI